MTFAKLLSHPHGFRTRPTKCRTRPFASNFLTDDIKCPLWLQEILRGLLLHFQWDGIFLYHAELANTFVYSMIVNLRHFRLSFHWCKSFFSLLFSRLQRLINVKSGRTKYFAWTFLTTAARTFCYNLLFIAVSREKWSRR